MKTITTDICHDADKRIQFLDSLRAIAIIMVVGVHALAYCHPLLDNQYAVASFIVHAAGVPIFFFVDGYLLTLRCQEPRQLGYISSVKKSAYRLLVPWLIFTLIYLIARYCYELAILSGDISIEGLSQRMLVVGHSPLEVAIAAYGSVFCGQMYFLVSLFLIRLCSPLFKKIIVINSYAVIGIVLVVYFLAYLYGIKFLWPFLYISGGQEPILHALWGMQFYLLGMLIAKTQLYRQPKKLFVIFSLLLLMSFLQPFDIGVFAYLFSQYSYVLALFFLFVLFGNKLPFLNTIGRNTMGIYLIHAPIVLKAVSLMVNTLIDTPLLSFIIGLFSTFLVSLLISLLIRNTAFGSLAFGLPSSTLKG